MVWLAETVLNNLRQVVLSYKRTFFFPFTKKGVIKFYRLMRRFSTYKKSGEYLMILMWIERIDRNLFFLFIEGGGGGGIPRDRG